MKYLNLGCGNHFSSNKEWTNVDFVTTGKDVLAHNLLNGIPFDNDSFDLVYHSHVLEHFSKKDGEEFLGECYRVLKPGGIIRIVIPDLECIADNYLRLLKQGNENPENQLIRLNYEWMLLEMYDQTVRNTSGGNMSKYLSQAKIENEDFVFNRIGREGIDIRESFLKGKKSEVPQLEANGSESLRLISYIKKTVKKFLLKKLKIDSKIYAIGQFRVSGEIHQWMYDRYSLSNLLKKMEFHKVSVQTADNSYIKDWKEYSLDERDGEVRKPDSLFIEAIK